MQCVQLNSKSKKRGDETGVSKRKSWAHEEDHAFQGIPETKVWKGDGHKRVERLKISRNDDGQSMSVHF